MTVPLLTFAMEARASLLQSLTAPEVECFRAGEPVEKIDRVIEAGLNNRQTEVAVSLFGHPGESGFDVVVAYDGFFEDVAPLYQQEFRRLYNLHLDLTEAADVAVDLLFRYGFHTTEGYDAPWGNGIIRRVSPGIRVTYRHPITILQDGTARLVHSWSVDDHNHADRSFRYHDLESWGVIPTVGGADA